MKRKTYILFSVLFLFLFSTIAFADDDKNALTAEQILEKHFAAIGGKDKLNSIKSRVALGQFKAVNTNLTSAVVFFTESPNRLAVFYRFQNFDWNFTFDGSKFFSRPNELLARNAVLTGRSSRLQDKFEEMYSSGLMFNNLSLYNVFLTNDPNVTLKANKTKKINNRPAYVVEVKHKKNGSMKAYFDAETFMWVRTDYGKVEISDTRLAIDNSGGVGLTIDFYLEASDFREVDGVKLPFNFKYIMVPPVSPSNRASEIEVEIKEYKHNVTIDPKMFK